MENKEMMEAMTAMLSMMSDTGDLGARVLLKGQDLQEAVRELERVTMKNDVDKEIQTKTINIFEQVTILLEDFKKEVINNDN